MYNAIADYFGPCLYMRVETIDFSLSEQFVEHREMIFMVFRFSACDRYAHQLGKLGAIDNIM